MSAEPGCRTPGLLGAGPAGRCEHLARYGPLPGRPDPVALLGEVDRAGLTGRGGASFPSARKIEAVAACAALTGRDPVVIGNGTEGEPVSDKDKTLMERSPHLVLDGAEVAAVLSGAGQAVIVAHRRAIGSVRRALAERPAGRVALRARVAAEGFVAGEATAVAHWVARGRPVPTPTPPRLAERGPGGAPTLVLNVETLAHLALIARYGADWFRSAGTAAEPGSMLVTVCGGVREPCVLETAIGTPVRQVLARAGGPCAPPRAVLFGGYSGSWTDAATVMNRPLSAAGLADLGAVPGAGVVAVLPADDCPLRETARIVRYLASQTAGQCGPCVFGLDAIAGQAERIARGASTGLLERWLSQVAGRGGCSHPSGVVRLMRSALRVFEDELAAGARK